MPYLPTTQAYLEQSALLLEAYPSDTRITTKYSFPSQRPSSQNSKPKDTESTPPAPPVATLTLKTYNPASGICLKYRTNKAAEVGRLITSLGKLAGGANVAALGLGNAAPAVQGDVEMTDAPEDGAAVAAAAAAAKTEGNKGVKGKKKGGKGKR
ncbi:hypothetical protein ETB97_006365 [Aspergillus alliaceus]|uniref:Signal recognition particle 9 kDa protein-domain-containing protein n=1 Tax=Petromyces alliaceus TaxID=209559 RepID=A0A5N7CDL1_PETAA|nr:signal recognition particle 9 kDa protein-domain-containing protein [Aspergillus alliaceus]KAB8234869.1 signal recognition particle 9 kDa protein-domain-containing protein [Aspergillus alliaceus]KAE8392204.1 signal recognition particle 9 kDa protein-domain-containing protein [Aspergillus alliaceus]KAF5864827.1 hypothetical protein ETB97_006365 [Aspergillus burnettii]